MATRCRYTGEFKAKVPLEALRGDKTIQEIAARHKVHPNQVSAWKQRAVEGLREVFSKGAERMDTDNNGLAERRGFEPLVPFWGTHDFQSCTLSQTRSPLRRAPGIGLREPSRPGGNGASETRFRNEPTLSF